MRIFAKKISPNQIKIIIYISLVLLSMKCTNMLTYPPLNNNSQQEYCLSHKLDKETNSMREIREDETFWESQDQPCLPTARFYVLYAILFVVVFFFLYVFAFAIVGI